MPYSRIHVSRVFRKAARAGGLKDFHFHDLRHHDGPTRAHDFEAPATDEEVRAAALPYVRKVSGSAKASRANSRCVTCPTCC